MKVQYDDNEQVEIDDLYAQNAEVRIERMDGNFFWIWIKEADGTQITIHVTTPKAHIRAWEFE